MGSLLAARGVATPAPLWSAAALVDAPDEVARVHREYAAAGACVHIANTFRTKERQAGARWRELLGRAVGLARGAVPAGHRVAGSLAPLEDCYRPDLSPREARGEHREVARALAGAGVDVIVCETFPHVGEGLVALEEAVATGVPAWMAFTAGPDGSLMSVERMAEGAAAALDRGASAVMVNCTAAARTLPYVARLVEVAAGRAPVGAYANAGDADWNVFEAAAVERYVAAARSWIEAGAEIVGGCCGTGPAHIAALAGVAARRG